VGLWHIDDRLRVIMYDEYVTKIKKVVRVRNGFFHFRFLILSLAGIALATTGSLVSTKGIVQDVTKLEQSYVYGDPLFYQSQAFLSTAEFEFRSVNETTWSRQEPRKPGSYLMRSKAPNSFSSFYYGQEQSFTITPLPLVVSPVEERLNYGTTPTLDLTGGLVYGDELKADYTFAYENEEEDVWNITPVVSSLHLLSSSGEDVTSCYDLQIQSKAVTILPRDIAISTSSSAKVYDDTPLSNPAYSLIGGTLVKGDHLELLTSASQRDAGHCLNRQSFKVLREDGLDMSRHYHVSFQEGSLEVSSRTLYLKSASKSFVYDGENKAFTLDDITIESKGDGLLSDQKIVYELTSANTMLRPGTYSNSFSAKISSGEKDVSLNYDIHYDFGTTTITPRPLSVLSSSSEHTYDGESYSDNRYSISAGSLAEKDEIASYRSAEVKEAGSYSNACEFKIVDKTSGEDFTACYTIEKSFGSLLIKKIDLAVELIPLEITYDGLPHQNKYRIVSGALAKNDSFKILVNPHWIDAGVYDNDAFALDILNGEGLSNLANYNLTLSGQSKAMTITKRPLSLHSLDQSKTYDGQGIASNYDETSVLYQIDSGSLAEGEYLTYKQKNNPVNAGKEAIRSHISIFHRLGATPSAEDRLVSQNYDISLTEGTFTIDKRSLIITTLDYSHPYNRDTSLPKNGPFYALSGAGLVTGESISHLSISCPGIAVGDYAYTIDEDSLQIANETGDDVTANYLVTYVNTGHLSITKREYSVTMLDGERYYDGTAFSSDKYHSENLLEGDYLAFEGLSSVTHVKEGNVENKPSSIKVLMADGSDVSANYELTSLTSAHLHVNPRPITLTSASLSKAFDGYPLGSSQVSVGGQGLAAGDSLNISSLASETIKNVKDSGSNTFTFTITNAAGEDVTGDYDVTLNYGTINILPCRLELKPLEITKVYDGKALLFAGGLSSVDANSSPVYLYSGTLPDTYSLTASLYANTELLLANTYSNPWTKYFTLTSTRDTVDMANFAISWDNADVIISKRPLTIQSLGGTMAYSGNPFPSTIWFSLGSLAAGDSITYDATTPLVEVCQNVDNPIGTAHIVNTEGRDVTASYDINYIYGKVTIA